MRIGVIIYLWYLRGNGLVEKSIMVLPCQHVSIHHILLGRIHYILELAKCNKGVSVLS